MKKILSSPRLTALKQVFSNGLGKIGTSPALRRFSPKVTKRSPSFYAWATVAYVLALILTVLLARIAFSGKELTQMAIASRQSVTVNIATGEISGMSGSEGNSLENNNTASSIDGSEGMAQAPLPSLTEQTEKGGVLPIVAIDGTQPWKYYAKPYTAKDKQRPIVAIVLTNIGLSRPQTEDTLKLPKNFTLSFSPYANDTGKWATRARGQGFESVIDLPIQAENYPLSDPGSFGLMEDLSPDENMMRLRGVLMQFPAFEGVLASEGEKMTMNKEEIRPYLIELKRRGLLFIYVKTTKNTGFEEFARSNFFYTVGVDKVLDQDLTRSVIAQQLQSLVALAKTQGYAVGLAHSYPPTLAELAAFAASLQDQGVDLVPVSAVAFKVLP